MLRPTGLRHLPTPVATRGLLGKRMSNAILHDHLPHAPWLDPAAWRLPGVQPLALEDWLIRDEVFAPQMALRDRLIAERVTEVHTCLPSALAAARECLDAVLDALRKDMSYAFSENSVTRPDGETVPIDRDQPLLTIGRLQQADVCLMEAGPEGHVLTGANLCFPAHWTLAEKIGRPLSRIHGPVHEYDAGLEKRVQRLFDAMRPDQVLWRANAILYSDPALFTPSREGERPTTCARETARYVRSERQTLRRLPETGAVVFTIHTYMISLKKLTDTQREAMWRAGLKFG